MQIEEDRIIRLEVILMASSVQKILTNKSVKIVNKHAKESQINYDLLLSNFDKFLNTFTLSSLENLQPTYASQPQIGEIKK